MDFITLVVGFGIIGVGVCVVIKVLEFIDDNFGTFPATVLFFMMIGAFIYFFLENVEFAIDNESGPAVCGAVQYELDKDVPYVNDEEGFVVCNGQRVYMSMRNYLIEGERE